MFVCALIKSRHHLVDVGLGFIFAFVVVRLQYWSHDLIHNQFQEIISIKLRNYCILILNLLHGVGCNWWNYIEHDPHHLHVGGKHDPDNYVKSLDKKEILFGVFSPVVHIGMVIQSIMNRENKSRLPDKKLPNSIIPCVIYCKSLFKRNFIFMPLKVAFNRPINNHIYETA